MDIPAEVAQEFGVLAMENRLKDRRIADLEARVAQVTEAAHSERRRAHQLAQQVIGLGGTPDADGHAATGSVEAHDSQAEEDAATGLVTIHDTLAPPEPNGLGVTDVQGGMVVRDRRTQAGTGA